MNISNDTLYKMAVNMKAAVKVFVTCEDSKVLDNFLQCFTEEEKNILLKKFDRYGDSVEFEKSGIRYDNYNNLVVVRLGYTTEDEILKSCSKSSLDYRLRMTVVGQSIPVKSKLANCITYPTTSSLLETFRMIMDRTIFEVSMDDAAIYGKAKQMKLLISDISENGFNDEYIEKLTRLLSTVREDKIDYLLMLFDNNKSDFGIRCIMSNDKAEYVSVNTKGKRCQFKYNSLASIKTVDLIKRWKKASKSLV